MQMVAPGSEQKVSLPTPPQIASQAPPSQPEAYCKLLYSSLGVRKVEIINNEVIAAGQLKSNLQQLVLVHCRVTPALLEFTIRGPS